MPKLLGLCSRSLLFARRNARTAKVCMIPGRASLQTYVRRSVWNPSSRTYKNARLNHLEMLHIKLLYHKLVLPRGKFQHKPHPSCGPNATANENKANKVWKMFLMGRSSQSQRSPPRARYFEPVCNITLCLIGSCCLPLPPENHPRCRADNGVYSDHFCPKLPP